MGVFDKLLVLFGIKKRIKLTVSSENIFSPITPKSIFFRDWPVFCNVDATNVEYPWAEDVQKLKSAINSTFILSENRKRYIEEEFLIPENVALIYSWAEKVEPTPIGFSHSKFHYVQFNHFISNFIDNIMIGHYWSAGLALAAIFEIQLRVILISSKQCVEGEAQKMDFGNLPAEFEKAHKAKKLCLTDEEYLSAKKCISTIKKTRDWYFAHSYPQTLVKSIFKGGRPDSDAIERFAFQELLSEGKKTLNKFYKQKVAEQIESYSIFHNLFEKYYKSLFLFEIREANKRVCERKIGNTQDKQIPVALNQIGTVKISGEIN